MEKPIKKIHRFLLWFFATIIAGGSLVGCGMYGPPPRKYYTMNGKVIQKGGKPIENISVTITETNDQVFTSKDGSFEIVNKELLHKDSVTIKVEDVDGDKNGGEFISETIEVDDIDDSKINIEMEPKK